MLMRTIVGLAMLPALFWILYIAPTWAMSICIAVVCVMAVWEILRATKFIHNKTVFALAAALSALTVCWNYFGGDEIDAGWGLFAFTCALFAVWMRDREHVKFEHIAGALIAAVLIGLSFSSVLRIREMENGIYLIILPFIASWVTDSCAYIVGVNLGRRRIAPFISPNKTLEGTIGGIAGCVIAMPLYGLLINVVFGFEANYIVLVLLGLLGALSAQFGDLCLSLIKRQFGIKDYGNLMPGHGGVLDRFDSVLFAAPLVGMLLTVLTVFRF